MYPSSAIRKDRLLWPHGLLAKENSISAVVGSLCLMPRGPDVEAFFQIVMLSGLRWEITPVCVSMARNEDVLRKAHLVAFGHGEELS